MFWHDIPQDGAKANGAGTLTAPGSIARAPAMGGFRLTTVRNGNKHCRVASGLQDHCRCSQNDEHHHVECEQIARVPLLYGSKYPN